MTDLEKKVRKALKKVVDPELNINIVDLGLVYDVRDADGVVTIEMTLTSPGCPLAGIIDDRVREVTGKIKEIKETKLELVWDPPWNEDMVSEEARAELGFD